MWSPFSSLWSSLNVTIPLLSSAAYRWLTMVLRVSSPLKLRNTSYLDTRGTEEEEEDAIVEVVERFVLWWLMHNGPWLRSSS